MVIIRPNDSYWSIRDQIIEAYKQKGFSIFPIERRSWNSSNVGKTTAPHGSYHFMEKVEILREAIAFEQKPLFIEFPEESNSYEEIRFFLKDASRKSHEVVFVTDLIYNDTYYSFIEEIVL